MTIYWGSKRQLRCHLLPQIKIRAMLTHTISASSEISAPAERVYAIIADYRDAHTKIVPRPPFVSLEVEEGGVGAGTKVRFQMRLMGRLQTFRAIISEPEPGRVLDEQTDTGALTRFTVEPRAGGAHAYVTIATTIAVRPGLLGRVEGWMAERMLRPVYMRELAQLGAVARSG